MVKFAFNICWELYAVPYIKNIYQNEHEIYNLKYLTVNCLVLVRDKTTLYESSLFPYVTQND